MNGMAKGSIRLVLATAVASMLVLPAAPASAADVTYPIQSGVYGKRYCEMAVANLTGVGLAIHVDIYNTFGLNDCPTAAWEAATTKTALDGYKTAFAAAAVQINGPRWWAFDRIGGVLGGETVNFGSIGMRKAATLEFPTPSLPPFYTPFTVNRTSTWVYAKGTWVRTLTAPDGRKYAMQAWTTQVSTKVKASSLNTLASGKAPLLKLPKGWKYRAAKATRSLTVVAPGTMTIVQDNLKNVYSRIS